MTPPDWRTRLFTATTALLPRSVREADGDDIRRTFRDQLDDARPGWERTRIALRSWRRLLGVVVVEWIDEWGGAGRAHTNTRRRGRGSMGMLRAIRHAVRGLRRAPSFTLTTVALVGIGIGTVTTVFTVVDDVLLRPLPYPAADRLTYLTNGSHNGATLRRLDDVEAFDLWTATSGTSVILTRPGAEPLQVRRVETTPSFFTLFGARPELGRLLVDGDRDAQDRVVLTHGAWTELWGADPAIVGSTIQVDGVGLEVVGVLSDDFVLPTMLVSDPVHMFRHLDWSNPSFDSPGYHAHSVVARLAPGAAMATADEQMELVAAAVAAAHPDYYDDGPQSWPLQSLHERTTQDVQSGLSLLFGAVALLLLVACANVAHLFMARGLTKAREVAIRRAMGARSGDILAGLAAESVVVGLVGGLLGLAFTWVTLSLVGTVTAQLPRGTTIALDPRALLFGVGLATSTALVFGMLPAMRTLAGDVQTTLRGMGRGVSGGRGVAAVRSGLVVGEVALSLVLVASAGLLMRSFLTVSARDPGVTSDGLYVLPLGPRNVETPDDYRFRMDAVAEALRQVPGVRSVSYGIEAPFEFTGGDSCCWSSRQTSIGSTGWAQGTEEGDGAQSIRLAMHPVTASHFVTFGTDLVGGQGWTDLEVGGGPFPFVVSESYAVRVFGSIEGALGQLLEEPMDARIVGVAEETLHYGLDQPHDYALYMPIEALPFPINRASFGIRVDRASSGLGQRLREAVWSVEPDLPVPTLEPMDDWIARSSAARRLASLLLSAFGVVALVLAAAGLYGTLLYAVGQKRKELGIRMALGADRRSIESRVVLRGFVLAVIGSAAGAVIAWWLGRLLESFLFGVTATDPLALAGSALALLGTAVFASWLPARRAGRVDPLETLRAE